MNKFQNKKLMLFLIFLTFVFPISVFSNEQVAWEPWTNNIFEKAKKENKLVILDLEAIWCHWCHVMKKTTYEDESIKTLLNKHFICVRVDQDSRPDLSNKYKQYGWPATIIFNSKGEELAKRSGYIPADSLKFLLEEVIKNPIPEKPLLDLSMIKFSSKPYLSNNLRNDLIMNHLESFDNELGGLNIGQKFIDRDTVEYALLNISIPEEKEIAIKTLNASLMLIDPVWGGVYQYSTMGGWNYPHFEKLANIQGEYMRIYSLAYSILKDEKYLNATLDIYKYLERFLRDPAGVFYTSQDADLIEGVHSEDYFNLNNSERIKQGIPKVDKHIYSSFNGQIINGLLYLYDATGSKIYLEEAINATNWILKHRQIKSSVKDLFIWLFGELENVLEKLFWIIKNFAFPEIGFSHGEFDQAGPYLNDTLNMGKVFLSLFQATHDHKWLIKAEQSLRFIKKNFEAPIAGFSTSKSSCEICAVKNPDILTEENIDLTRLAIKAFALTGNDEYKFIYEHAMKYLSTNEIALRTITEPGILILDNELKSIDHAN